jgi:hypothetical protein
MTDQHRATPEQWANIERWAGVDSAVWRLERLGRESCILELRARIEQLEATSDRLTPAPGEQWNVRIEGIQHGPATPPSPNPAVERVRDMQDRIQEGSLTLAEALAEIGAPTPAPADSLVERVTKAIHPSICADVNLYQHEARAAIREVVAWLHENDAAHNMGGDAAEVADLLGREVNQ